MHGATGVKSDIKVKQHYTDCYLEEFAIRDILSLPINNIAGLPLKAGPDEQVSGAWSTPLSHVKLIAILQTIHTAYSVNNAMGYKVKGWPTGFIFALGQRPPSFTMGRGEKGSGNGGRSRRSRKGWFRRSILALCCLISCLGVILGSAASPWGGNTPATAASSEIRGVWLTSNDMDVMLDRTQLIDAFSQLASLNFNTVYPMVWNSGYVLFPSTTAQKEEIQPFIRRGLQDYDVLEEVTTQAHNHGLLVMPWFEFGFMTPPTSELATNHPDWITQRQDGRQTWVGAAGEVAWLNPFKPEVQQFLLNLVAEVLNQYDVDGIQFDDHISLPVEFGYDRYTRTLYHQETGKTAPSNFRDPAWMKWRADKLTAFVGRLKQTVEAKKPGAILSIAPNPYDVAYSSYLQDWVTWVQRNLVDEIVIQIYRHEMPAFLAQLDRPEVKATRQKIPTGVGVLTGLRTKPVPIKFIQQKVQAARSRGLGVSFFYYESLWETTAESPADRLLGLQQLFPWPAQRLALTSEP